MTQEKENENTDARVILVLLQERRRSKIRQCNGAVLKQVALNFEGSWKHSHDEDCGKIVVDFSVSTLRIVQIDHAPRSV